LLIWAGENWTGPTDIFTKHDCNIPLDSSFCKLFCCYSGFYSKIHCNFASIVIDCNSQC